jgi:hypothetical protein
LSPILTSLKIWLQAILDTQVVFRAKAFTLSFFLSFCPILSFFLCLSTCQMRLSTVLSLFVYLSNVSFYHFLSVFFFCLVKRYSFFIISNFILLSEALLFPFLLCLSFRLFKHYTFTILSLFPPLYICLSISFCISASVCLSTSFLSRMYYFVLLSTFQRLKSYIQSSSIQ